MRAFQYLVSLAAPVELVTQEFSGCHGPLMAHLEAAISRIEYEGAAV